MASIRELFHSIGNKHNLITVGCGVTKEIIGDCFEEKEIPKDLKDELREISKNLERLIQDAKEADRLTNELKDRIYKIIDPDTVKPKEP